MSLFEAAGEFGVFPSGIVLGIVTGVASLPAGLIVRHIKWRWAVFIIDMFSVLIFSFCLFSLGVGMEGHLRYPTFFGALLGFAAVRVLYMILVHR